MKITLRVAAALVCCGLVWLVTSGRSQNGLADVGVGSQATHVTDQDDPIYLVEVRTRPDYRLISYEPLSGTSTPIFVVPEFGVISSIALSPDGGRLALAYTNDYREPGTGIYVIDLVANDGELIDDDGVLSPVVADRSRTFFDDLQYGSDGSTLWASVKDDDGLAVIAIDIASGEITNTIRNAVDPAVVGDRLAYLAVDPDESRRSIGLVDLVDGAESTVDVLDREFDLGNLLLSSDGEQALVTALVPLDQPGIQIGEPAEAHGSHEGPAQWLTVDLDSGRVRRLLEHEPVTVRDAVLLPSGLLAISTADGLVFMSDPLTPVVASRVITELAG